MLHEVPVPKPGDVLRVRPRSGLASGVVPAALELPRVKLCIADDLGLGKVIEAGLVMQEIALRGKRNAARAKAGAAAAAKGGRT